MDHSLVTFRVCGGSWYDGSCSRVVPSAAIPCLPPTQGGDRGSSVQDHAAREVMPERPDGRSTKSLRASGGRSTVPRVVLHVGNGSRREYQQATASSGWAGATGRRPTSPSRSTGALWGMPSWPSISAITHHASTQPIWSRDRLGTTRRTCSPRAETPSAEIAIGATGTLSEFFAVSAIGEEGPDPKRHRGCSWHRGLVRVVVWR